MAGFPNLFMLVGPNTGLGDTSLIYMRTGVASVEVRPQAQVAYNEVVQRRIDGTVWTAGGCTSWYLDVHGHNTTLWPTFTWRFRRATLRFQPAEYPAYEHVAQPVAAR